MMKEKELIIRSSMGAVVEDVDFETSIFCDQYKAAFEAIEHFLKNNSDRRNIDRNAVLNNTDNIFAFIGERGSGKTSCMLSVREQLSYRKRYKLPGSYSEIKKAKYLALEPIDPSFFDKENDIVGLFIAQLYKEFNKQLHDSSDDISLRNEVLNAFEQAQKNYKYLYGQSEKTYDDLEDLELLSVSVNLRISLSNLVTAYSKYMGKDGAYLLLTIDDIDLHSASAAKMAEEIRRYLTVGNIIILMSLKLSQLTILKAQQYFNEYEMALNKQIVTSSSIEEMAEHYITKFIPYPNRIYMPVGDVYGTMLMAFEENPNDRNIVSQRIPELIFEKTRYLFYNSSVQTSFVVPDNLRELCQLALMLNNMHPYRDGKDANKNEIRYDYNKVKFRQYFTQTWTANHFSKNTQRQLMPLSQVKEIIQYNAVVLRILNGRFERVIDEMKNQNTEIAEILNEGNETYNISLGDVLAVMQGIETRITDKEDLYFIFYIRSLYSMMLYETYDIMTGEGTVPTGNQTRSLVLKTDPLGGSLLNDYHRLVGGSFLSSILQKPLPAAQDGHLRSPKSIDIKELNALISDCVDNYKTVSDWKIRLAEFFMLCVSRPYSSKNSKGDKEYIDPKYRINENLWYTQSLSSDNQSNGVFDVSSFFFNITRVKDCYSRFKKGDVFYKYANDAWCAKSLYSCFKIWTKYNNREIGAYNPPEDKRDIKDFDENNWLSWAGIRNIDVLMDLVNKLNVEGNSEDRLIISDFFYKISGYAIDTYYRDPNGDPYKINFKFTNLLQTLLTRDEVKDEFNLIYNFQQKVMTDNQYIRIDVNLAVRGMMNNENNKKDTYINRLRVLYWGMWNDEVKELFDNIFNTLPERISRAVLIEKIQEFNITILGLVDNATPNEGVEQK